MEKAFKTDLKETSHWGDGLAISWSFLTLTDNGDNLSRIFGVTGGLQHFWYWNWLWALLF